MNRITATDLERIIGATSRQDDALVYADELALIHAALIELQQRREVDRNLVNARPRNARYHGRGRK